VTVRSIDPFSELTDDAHCSFRWPSTAEFVRRKLRPASLVAMISWSRVSRENTSTSEGNLRTNFTVTGCAFSLRYEPRDDMSRLSLDSIDNHGLLEGDRFSELFVLLEGDISRAQFSMSALVGIVAVLPTLAVVFLLRQLIKCSLNCFRNAFMRRGQQNHME